MNKKIFCSSFLFLLLLLSCSSPKETKKEDTPPTVVKPAVPEITIQVASLDLSKVLRKIDKTDIEMLVQIMKKNKIDVLALESIIRYPGVTTRIDIVDELSAQAGMRQAFGENMNLNGRQTGNAVLSNYPIISSTTTPYKGLHSSNFETALQAVIDCGTRQVVVISTHIPENANITDQDIYATTLSSFTRLYIDNPIISTGNLPKPEDLRKFSGFFELRKNGDMPAYWFSNDGSLKLMNQKTESTPLGTMMIGGFGIFPQRKS